jgi:hypothetical protein
MKTWNELSKLDTFEERFRYLILGGSVGLDTFGMDRFLNQMFYNSYEWRHVREEVILRDWGCDLGVDGHEIHGKILIHHMNPITKRDILDRSDILMNPEYLITVSHETHNAIHYGDESILHKYEFIDRKPNDQCPWRHA